MMKIRVTFEVDVPDLTPYNDIQAWLEYSLNATGCLKGDNRLINQGLEADSFSVDFDECNY